jgi:hypothetical protein
MGKLRKQLSAPGLLGTARKFFGSITDTRKAGCPISLADALMSGLAIFSLKYASLLQYDRHRLDPAESHNLRTLYGVQRAPSDTQMRAILDGVDSSSVRPVFKKIFSSLQRGKVLESYSYLDDYYLLSVDGTGLFSSNTIHCGQCCMKKNRAGEVTYYHQLLGAVIVHPDQREVIPLAPEPITRQDGATKNDCERNAAKRLLPSVRREHPHLKIIVVEDALAANAPHIRLLQSLNMRFILGVKPGDHVALFKQVEECARQHQISEQTLVEGEVTHRFRWVNGVSLNQQHPDLKVNFLEYWEESNGKKQQFTWITDFTLSIDNVFAIMKGGRSRWKVENETFNTLKNQGYHFEHNFGHGHQHLATNFSLLMLLAFAIDQIQAHGCAFFQQALRAQHTKRYLWEKMRAAFTFFYIRDWEQFFTALIDGPTICDIIPDTS